MNQEISRGSPSQLSISNGLLTRLAPLDLAVFEPALEAVRLEINQVVFSPGEAIPHVYFVESGLISIVGLHNGRRSMEVGMIGNEGMAGVEIVLGGEHAAHEALVQSPGRAWRLEAGVLRDAMRKSRALHDFLLLFAHVFMVQGSHASIVAGRARVSERLARGLLMWHDRIDEDDLIVTHEFLALLIGVRRQGVTTALHELEGKHLLRAVRNRVRILDRAGLQEAANGFYGVPEAEYRRLIG